MGRRDHYTKRLLNDPKVVSDIFNYLTLNRKAAVMLNSVQHLDGEQVTVVGKKLDRRIRDRLWLVTFTFSGSVYQVILGIELQSAISYDMPVRVMHYDALSYAHQVKAHEARHCLKADLSDAAFLSGITVDDKLIPVVTVVLYFGTLRWNGALKLSDMLIMAPCQGIRSLINVPVMHLIDPHRLSEQQLLCFESELREVLAFIKYADNRQKLMCFIDRYCKGRTISGNAVDVINAFTKAKIKRVHREEEVKMCRAIIEMKQIARAEGKREGLKEGMEVGIEVGERKGKKEGKLETLLANIRSLNKTLGLTYEEAMKALRVPKAKREELLKLLPST